MNPQQLNAQAQQAATQGQQLLNSDTAQQGQSQAAYNQQQGQAGQANQNLQNYTQYMQGAGSGTNLYNTGLAQGETTAGYNPGTAGQLGQNLAAVNNQLSQLSSNASSGLGSGGMAGSQLANYYAARTAPLSQAAQGIGQSYGAAQQALTNAMTMGNQYAGAGLQGENQTAGALGQVFSNYQAQASQSAALMNQFATLAQQQGGLNAQEQQAYDAAINSYQQAQLAIAQAKQATAQAGLFGSQTVGQNLQNQQTQAAISAAAVKAANNPALTPQQAQSAAFLKSSGATPGSIYNYSPSAVPSAGSSYLPNQIGNFIGNL